MAAAARADAASASASAAHPADSCEPDQQQPRLVDLPDLGFDYPELREVKRRLRRALACAAPCPLSAVRRAYARALGEALGGGGGGDGGSSSSGYAWGPGGLMAPYYDAYEASSSSSSPCPAAAERELAAFVRAALAALLLDGGGGGGTAAAIAATASSSTSSEPLPPAALEQLIPCPARDPTLPPFPPGARLLLAANLRNAGRSAPSAAVQAVRLALALPPGGLAVGMHEGRSSDRTPFALGVLRLLLLPLRVPQNVTTGAKADPAGADALPRIERMAALRDAALAPWLGKGGVTRRVGGNGGGVSSSGGKDDDRAVALALGVLPLEAAEEDAAAPLLPPPLPPLARPDAVAFANDAFFCAEDVLRLAAHRAPIACGFDFYSAPWQVAAAEQAAQRRRRSGAGAEEQRRQRRKERRPDDDDDDNDDGNGNAIEDPAVRRDYEEDYESEELREPRAGKGGGGGGGGQRGAATTATATAAAAARPYAPPRGAARHYDKWVSRDRLGARLSNRPPYVRDGASAAQLARGMPVAAYCCWSGLALLDAAPLFLGAAAAEGGESGGGGKGGGVVFRAGGHPRDCPSSSECSLLCDDYRRAFTTAGRVGKKGGGEKSGGWASSKAAAAAGGGYRAVLDPAVRLAYDPEQSRALFAGARGGSSPLVSIPGFDVAPVDWALGPSRRWGEVAAVAAQLAAAAPVAPKTVDCCSLRPGKNFVRFRADCAPLEWRD